MSPAAIVFFAFGIVRQGAANVPALASLPLVETKKMLPPRTVNGTPLLVAVGPDGKSFRAFISRIDGKDAEFFLKGDTEADTKSTPSPTVKSWTLLDTATAGEWNFQGCAISGPSQGQCLDRVPALKDYWFDWRNYHPDTSIYKR